MSNLSSDPKSWAALSAIGVPTGGGGIAENPWRDTASHFVPRNLREAFSLCEFFFLNGSGGTYRQGAMRVVDYFITKIKLSGGDDDDNRKDFQKMLDKDLKATGVLRELGMNFQCYGNGLASLHLPFTRTVRTEAGHAMNLAQIKKFSYDTGTGRIKAYCPRSGTDQLMEIHDVPRRDPSKIKVVNWDPKRMTINMNPFTGDCEYLYEIPDYVKNEVRRGNEFFTRTLPLPFLECVRRNARFRFGENAIFHLKDATIAGLDLRGWGMPSILSAFRNFFRLQILHRQDETIMLDYITPLRLLSPKQGSYTEGNTIMNVSLQNWMQNMAGMIQQHRIDGASWNFVPMPVEYQPVGAEGHAIAPKEHIQMEEDRLLNALGVPPEFYRGSLTIQAAPVALRLFERTWGHLTDGYNDMLDWLVDEVGAFMKSGDYDAELEKASVVDDIDNKMWRLQAAAAELLSKDTAFSPMGVTASEEYDKLLEQQKEERRKTMEAERQLQMEEMTLEQQPEGEGGGGGGATPMDVQSQGDEIARRLLAQDEGTRRRELQAIRQQDPTLHAVVLERMDQLRTQARSAGQDQMMPQVLEGAPPPPPAETGAGGPAPS